MVKNYRKRLDFEQSIYTITSSAQRIRLHFLIPTRRVTAIKLRKNAIKNDAFSGVFDNSITLWQTTFCVGVYDVFLLNRD
jgi:hypothetical protein